MADDLEINIDTRELDRALSTLPEALQKKVLKKSLEAAAMEILRPMKLLAPERTDEPTPDSDSLPPGILQADLTTQVSVGETTGARVRIGPTEVSGHVARWQNNGWLLKTHGKKRNRQIIKSIPGKHFIEAAADEGAQAAIDVLIKNIADGLAEAQS